MKRKSLVLVILFVLFVMAGLPAQAAHLGAPTKVPGDATCSSVGSDASSSLKILPVAGGAYPGPGGVVITLSGVTRTTFDFDIDGGLVHDVIVKGSAANWYHYPSPVAGDDDLVAPNGNRLNHVEFCYVAGEVELHCNVPVSDTNESGNTTGTFTRFDDPFTTTEDECEGGKVAFLDVSEDRLITFIPRGLDVDSITYQATLTFPVVTSLPILQYDQDADGPKTFENVPACEPGEGGVEAMMPEGHTWCHVGFSVEGGVVTWNLFGIGDPIFR
jgi:hypothetical protein